MTTEEFIEKAKSKHGDRYDYSKVKYVKSMDKVIITCKSHGEFLQTPHKHSRGDGCPKCGIERIKEKVTGTLGNFLVKAAKKHGNKYDYSKVIYVSAKTRVVIICPTHGEFLQTPDSHTRGCGCTKCANESTANRMVGNRRVSVSNFIERAKQIHGDTYIYSEVVFSKTSDKVDIICNEHGKYRISVNKHLLGYKCPHCSMQTRVQNGWSTSVWEKAGKESSNFKAYSVYIVKCYNEDEEFYKIGKTFLEIEKRIKKFKEVGYSVDIIKVFTGTAAEMSTKEKHMHKMNKENKYLPNKKFCGKQECYKKVVV